MNLFGILHKGLSIIDKIAFAIISTYIIYVLFSPGLYILCLLYISGLIIYIKLSTKANKKRNKLRDSYDYVDITEHMYATTYRKRFYSGIYLLAILSILITSSCGLINIAYKQLDLTLNKEFVRSVEYIYDEVGFDDKISILHKVSPVIPNSTKKIVIEAGNSIKWANELVIVLTQISEYKDEETIRNVIAPYEIEMKERQKNIEDLCNISKIELLLIVLIAIMCKYSFRECLAYSEHRSIELK